MDDKRYSVGEIAAIAHISVRTLQHYDNIGLLLAHRITESGRRYYTESDIFRLEQILFYKSLGFSLDEIHANLIDSRNKEDVRELFVKQEYLLLRKIEQLNTSFAVIDASMKVIDIGNLPPFEVILQFIRLLPGDDVFEWAPSLLNADQQAVMAKHFKNLEDAQRFYHILKSLLIDALVLFYAHIAPSHPLAQELAKKWKELIETVLDENPALLEQFTKIGEISKFGVSRHQRLMEEAYGYIQKVVEIDD